MDSTLDIEQLEKRLAWLDNERRNDKTVIASLQSKLDNYETENSSLRKRLGDMESEITRLNTLMARLEQFEVSISALRTDANKKIDDIKGDFQEKFIVTGKNQQQIQDVQSDVVTLRKHLAEFDGLAEAIEDRKDEDIRLARLIEEVKSQVHEIGHIDEDYKRNFRMIEENRRQDVKRLTDIQGEVSAIRKRQDEIRGKQDLVGDTVRKFEGRIKNLLDAESERLEEQTAFIEKINVMQIDRDRMFKQWVERFNEIEKATDGLEEEIAKLDDTHNSVKKSQAGLDEVTQRFDRRVNEITEIQRLNEDRFRQEWTTFKSDDQKRWANYTLAQEEQNREMTRELETLTEEIASMETMIRNLQDSLQQVGREEIKYLQGLLKTTRESIENYNRIFKD